MSTDFEIANIRVKYDGTLIPNVQNVQGPEMSVSSYQYSYIGDTAVSKTPTVEDGGTVVVTLGYDPTNSVISSLFTAYKAKEKKTLSLLRMDGEDVINTFSATVFCSAFKFSGGDNNTQDFVELTYDVSGGWTVA